MNSMLLTCGEHEYTRYGFKQLLDKKCVDLLQPDVTWCGGLTETIKIVNLASAYNIPVIPHGSSIYSYHLQIAFTNCHIGELIMLAPNADTVHPLFGLTQICRLFFLQITFFFSDRCFFFLFFFPFFVRLVFAIKKVLTNKKINKGNLFLDEPLPKDGYITLNPNKHGFGVTLNPDLKLRRPYTHKQIGENISQILKFKYDSLPESKEKWLQKHGQGPAKVNVKSQL